MSSFMRTRFAPLQCCVNLKAGFGVKAVSREGTNVCKSRTGNERRRTPWASTALYIKSAGRKERERMSAERDTLVTISPVD